MDMWKRVYKFNKNTYTISTENNYDYTEEGLEFYFTEGNMSCDCNRSLDIQHNCNSGFPEFKCNLYDNEIKLLELWLNDKRII